MASRPTPNDIEQADVARKAFWYSMIFLVGIILIIISLLIVVVRAKPIRQWIVPIPIR